MRGNRISQLRLRQTLGVCIATAVFAGCDARGDESTSAPTQSAIAWREHVLPAPSGAPGRNVVRDAVWCGGDWYVLGAVFLESPTETRDTRPALWSSPDGSAWTSVPVEAHTYWGRRAILNSAACSRDRLVAVGARSGGAHGNPRVTTFSMDEAGRLIDVRAVFTQFGGVTATNVGPISGGPDGWLIVGNRLSGPGAWVTDDPQSFTRVEGAPGLTDDGDLESIAQSAAWDGEAWVMVGEGAVTGELLDPDPIAWTSLDGLVWARDYMPKTDEPEGVSRVVHMDGAGLVALGTQGESFAAWIRVDDEWKFAATFGDIAKDWVGAPYAASLVATADGLVATISNGKSYELWSSGDGERWAKVDTPVAPVVAGDHALAVGASDDEVLLVADDGSGGRIWSAAMN